MKGFDRHFRKRAETQQELSARLPVHRLTLAFPSALEKPFLERYRSDILPMQRLALLSGAMLYALFAVLDVLIVPGQVRTLWTIRFAVVCPLLLGCFCFSFSSIFKRHSQVLLAVVIAIAAMGIIVMGAVVPSPANYLYYAGLFLVFFYLYTFSGVLFTHAAVTGLLIVFAYEIVAFWVIHTPFYILTNNNFFFISASCLGMLACYSLEKSTRRNFYLDHLLEKERAKVVEANLVLERKVEERSRQLEKTCKQLVHSEKLATAGLLAASIVHEFGSPIFAIRNFLQNMQTEKIAEEDKNFIALAVEECDRLRTLLGSLRDFHRPTSGRKEAVDLHKILDDIILLCSRRLQAASVELHRQYDPELPELWVVKDQIKQVALNLLANAIDAVTNEEGGRVSITTEVQADAVVVHFEDNGQGIAPHLKDRIFEPFVSNKAAKIGTGLGLAIAYGIVRSHGGSIEAENRETAGARFSVTLPRGEKSPIVEPLFPFQSNIDKTDSES